MARAKRKTQDSLANRMGPRRMAVGLLIAMLLSGIGYAVALGSQEAPDPEPVPIEVPEARIGDRGTYNLTLSGQWRYDERLPGVPFEFVSYRLAPPAPLRDAEGRLREAERLETTGLSYKPDNTNYDYDAEAWVEAPAWPAHNETYWLDPAGSKILAYGIHDVLSEISPLTNLAPLSDLQRWHDTRQDGKAYLSEDWRYGACAIGESLQGRYAEQQNVKLPPCMLNALGHRRDEVDLRPVGMALVNGVVAFGYTGTAYNVNVTLWLADGLPVPVRYEATQMHDIDSNRTKGEGTFRLDLVGFERGRESRAIHKLDAASLPPLATLPRMPWGIDDHALGNTFSAQKAWEEAKTASPALQDLLARSPDAYVAAASLVGWNEPNERNRLWRLTVTDGHHNLWVQVWEQARLPSDPWGITGLGNLFLPQAPEPLMEVRYEVQEGSMENGTGLYPTPAHAPKELASIDALLERRALYSNLTLLHPDDARWSFSLRCDGAACEEPKTTYSVGHSHMDRRMVAEGVPPRAFGVDYAYSVLAIDENNKASWSMQSTFHVASGPSMLGSDSDPGQLSRPPSIVAAQPDSLLLLTTATAGGAGIIIGLLYWLWPAIKSAPAALFSRVRGDHLLRNPLRAQIHQLIEANPGIHHQAIVRTLDRGHGAVEHHLRKLLDAGMVSRIQGKGYTCYFPKGRVDFSNMASAPLLKSPVARSIVEQVRQNPGIRSAELARRLAVTPATVHYHVERMRSSGILEGTLAAGALRLQVSPRAA